MTASLNPPLMKAMIHSLRAASGARPAVDPGRRKEEASEGLDTTRGSDFTGSGERS